MSRQLTAGVLAAILAQNVRPILLYEGEFQGGNLNLWTGVGDLSWNAKTWTGAGHLLEISAVEEVSDVRAVNFTVALNGEINADLAIAMQSVRQGKKGTVWIGALDAAGALVVDPFKAFSGRLDRDDVTDDGTRLRIAVMYESRLIDLDRARERRYTHDDQQVRSPGDRGFEGVAGLQDAVISFGPPSGGGSGIAGAISNIFRTVRQRGGG